MIDKSSEKQSKISKYEKEILTSKSISREPKGYLNYSYNKYQYVKSLDHSI